MTEARALLDRFKSRLLRRTGAAEHPAETRGEAGGAGALDRKIDDRPRESAVERSAGRTGGVRPENIAWIFGAGRTGSTWIAAMIDELEGQTVWFEPRVGFVFEPRRFRDLGGSQFILSPQYKETWLRSIRNFVLDGADARFPRVTGPDDYLMIKEPAGSAGAPWLMEALPESRVVLLIRDPRDVAASWLDAARKGGWQNERKKDGRRDEALADKNPDAFVRRVSRTYVRNVSGAKKAYEAHDGRKALVRYEELRADTVGTMARMYSELGIPVEEAELSRVVKKHAWEGIPEKKKGEGKFYRKASPGSWREDLTPRQAQMVEKITASLLEEFYPNVVP